MGEEELLFFFLLSLSSRYQSGSLTTQIDSFGPVGLLLSDFPLYVHDIDWLYIHEVGVDGN